MLTNVDLTLLVLFEAVMPERHVGRAGARVHLPPSAISHGLTRLLRVLHDRTDLTGWLLGKS